MKTTKAYQLQNEHYIFVCYLFSYPVMFSSDPFCCSLLRISFAEGIPWNCKEVVDLRLVHPNAAQLSGIFFSKSTDTKLVYILVGFLFTSCSLLSACFSFSFACQISAHAQFFGKIKTNASRLYQSWIFGILSFRETNWNWRSTTLMH